MDNEIETELYLQSTKTEEDFIPPISYNGAILLIAMMTLLFLSGLTQGDYRLALHKMGFRDPITKAYTLLLTTPILFELMFNPLR